LCGRSAPTGIRDPSGVASLLALETDTCRYNPVWPSIDELEALLSAGIEVCSTDARDLAPAQDDHDVPAPTCGVSGDPRRSLDSRR